MAQQPIIFKSWRDLPLNAASLGNTSVNKTGSWRNVEPHHVEQIPPCSNRCPAGNDVVGFVTLAAEGNFEDAWRVLAQTSPFPGTCGRVCPHPCETECNRESMGGTINIHSIERFLGDLYRENPPEMKLAKPTHKRVAVIGSGPAGLSTAYQLLLAGHSVTVFEAHAKVGGMLRVGIPDYRLPPDVLDGEIARMKKMGLQIITETRIGRDIPFAQLMDKFHAVFAGTGLTVSRPLGAKNDDKTGVVSGTEVLRRINLGEPDGVGQRVLVVGGGNTAMDAARSLWRLGKDVKVMYRRTRVEMPAIAEEIDELIEEGIPIEFLATPVEVLHDAASGKLLGAKCIRMQLGKPDESGRRKPAPMPGSEFVVEADSIITAIGETADLSYLPQDYLAKTSWNIPADELGRTFEPKLFAGGDVADGAGTVTAAIGFGRKAAIAIDALLRQGSSAASPQAAEIDTADHGGSAVDSPLADAATSPSLRSREKHVVRYEDLNTAYFKLLERINPEHLPVSERARSFSEVRDGYDEIACSHEASRCFSCGTCPACDNCWVFCPDVAVKRVNDTSVAPPRATGTSADGGASAEVTQLYWVDYDYCKGCGLCAAECPRACIVMTAVR